MVAVASPTKMSLISADGRYLLYTFKEVFLFMISVGIDVSKGKSKDNCRIDFYLLPFCLLFLE